MSPGARNGPPAMSDWSPLSGAQRTRCARREYFAFWTQLGRDDPACSFTPRPLGHSFPNGIQQDNTRKRLAQIGDAPGVHRLIVRGLVVVGRHEDDRALRSRCRKSALQLDPRNSSEVDVEQQAGSRLRPAALEQRLRGGECPAFDAVVRNSRATPFRKPALSSTTITTVGAASPIFVSSPGAVMCPTVVADP